MREIIKAWLNMDEKHRNSILLNEIALLYEEVDELKQKIKELTDGRAYKRYKRSN